MNSEQNENFTLKEEVKRLRDVRHEYINELNIIKCRTEIMDERLQKLEELPTNVAVLMSQVKDWIANTKDYRDSLNAILTTMTTKINSLPCDKNEEKNDSKHKRNTLVIKFIWGAMLIIWGIVIAHLGWK